MIKESSNNKSGLIKWMLVILFVILSMSLIPGQSAQAASEKRAAKKAYSKLLSQSEIKWGNSNKYVSLSKCKFSRIYLDNNSVPELVIFSNGQTYAAEGCALLYTYKNGKAKFVSVLSASGTLKYYAKKGILIDPYITGGGYRKDYIKFTGSKLKWKLRYAKPSANSTEKIYYSTNGVTNKQITKAKFQSKLKKLVGSKKAKKVKQYKNTASNRKKYLY